jgi:uncharacterized membrane protein YeaQ/YmgE (transglycosylase-associated protein family)
MRLARRVPVAVLAGLGAGFVMKRGYGRGWDIVIGLVGSVTVAGSSRANGSHLPRA